VFHNDVIAVGTGHVLLCHERAYVDQPQVLTALGAAVGPSFAPLVVTDAELSVADAVATYLFNSQLIARPDGRLTLIAPSEVHEHPRARAVVERLVARGDPIAEILAFDLRQSMKNGGGPACLRLRVALTPAERAAVAANVFLNDALAGKLDAWIRRHYRDRLLPQDLGDPALLVESRRALDELTQLLLIGSVYSFQH
jgi:succinylarginine dihydrolase